MTRLGLDRGGLTIYSGREARYGKRVFFLSAPNVEINNLLIIIINLLIYYYYCCYHYHYYFELQRVDQMRQCNFDRYSSAR